MSFKNPSSAHYRHYKFIQSPFENSHRLTVGGTGRKIEASPVVLLLTGPFLGLHADVVSWGQTSDCYLLPQFRVRHRGFAWNLKSDTVTAFNNLLAQYAAVRGDTERGG